MTWPLIGHGRLPIRRILLVQTKALGDTLCATTKVLSKRESKSRPNAGIVEFEHHALNQRGEIVISYERTNLVAKRKGADK